MSNIPAPIEIDAKYASMVEVTEDSFFAVIGKLNVHPYAIGRMNGKFHHASEWRYVNDEFTSYIAVTTGNGYSGTHRNFVTQRFYNANASSLVKV